MVKFVSILFLSALLLLGCTSLEHAGANAIGHVASSQINKEINSKADQVCDSRVRDHVIEVASNCLLRNLEPYIQENDVKQEKIDLIQRSYSYCIKSELGEG